MVQVNQNTPLNLRVKFKKVGRLQYISHLDLVRTMNKIVVRAKLPLWYTEGFNPKPKMVFAAPLSIGTESQTEFVDIRLSEYIEPELAVKALNENLTEEMQALEAYYPTVKLSDMKWLSYTISIKTDNATDTLATKCEQTLLSERVEVLKKAKSGDMVTLNIRPLIKNVTSSLDGEILRLSCILSADQSRFLNPELVVKALKKYCGILSNPDLTKEYYTIMRETAYTENMEKFR